MPKKRSLESAGISDAQYLQIMERVAEQNYKDWGLPNSDAALIMALNDNTYNYRGYYNKYPNGKGNAVDHWTDEFKTVYHPTFSKESKYSGKKSQYNPKGLTGGTWNGDIFIPADWQRSKKKEGGIHIASSKRGGEYTKTYTDSRGREVTFPRIFKETDEQYEARYAERVAMSERNAAANKARFDRRIAANKAGAARLNRAINTVTNAMEEQAKANPFTGQEIQQAAEEQRQEKLDKWRDYKKGINATITAAELGLSGASLLGAYANWRNWATAANATKRGIANLLQRAQLPMQVGGTLIDGYQTYDALQNNDNYNSNYNGISTGLGVAGSVGASDVFLNSRFHSPKIDRVLDAMGVIQNSGDFIKFGYDSMFGNKKAYGGSIHIAPSKRGTFTAAASKHGMGVQEFASRVLRNKEDYSPAMVKKANFARNASKWNH